MESICLLDVNIIENIPVRHHLRDYRKRSGLRFHGDCEESYNIGVRRVHPTYRFLAERLYKAYMSLRPVSEDGTNGDVARLMSCIDSPPHPDGLNGHNYSVEFPPSDVSEFTTCEHCLLDSIASQCANKITFRDLA